ncbi:MAG TPA: glycine cleavage system protein GcvH [Beijerinckiaceae bacterium]|nr:glycine cleavage system protein GcvH [Beijerinckiaceae bacterium]
MAETYFTKDHEFIRVAGDVGVVGITDYAQKKLGDVVFVELPEPGLHVSKGAQVAVVESVKAASEIFAPVSGEVLEVNRELDAAPAKVNEDPLDAGWFLRLRIADAAELADLMDEAAYADFIASLD